ncbi:uncharacterized protein LOC106557825 isoform X8 [Canis lupus familiaris]|uniref:uncharacterized protein LOC106557825 isoform X8 n=1 Tax=Canis lupus familiaris TaxID=9615 RepID=UPI0018F4AC58|nr:uncharacterized protein LOC106557825 isoform X8 [Canis lupus familiaris]XP_038315278.1 uncharacterized protein LOC106557825 isoform X8 [Canis lupus familiaris]XP_038430602.1 uncharacterized protein LOC106557825 isoform X8 [Canis lupus familiaris]
MERLLGGAMRGNHVEGPRELPETAQAFVKGCGSCPWWGLALPRFAGDICHGAVMAGEEPGWSTHACPAPPEAGYHGGAWGRGRFSRTLSFQFRCAAIFGWDWQKAVLPTCTRQCFCASQPALGASSGPMRIQGGQVLKGNSRSSGPLGGGLSGMRSLGWPGTPDLLPGL